MHNDLSIKTMSLKTGNENVGLGIVEIISIPHVNIIGDEKNTEFTINRYKQEFSGLLSQLYQQYKGFKSISGQKHELSFELLWLSIPVQNQPHRAKVRLFLVIRAIDSTPELVVDEVSSCIRICLATLDAQKYDVALVDFQELQPVIAEIKDASVRVLLKEAETVNLQNEIIPLCYTFDRFTDNRLDLSLVSNALKESPNCAVSFQLIPTEYSQTETLFIDRTVQVLSMLGKGVMEQGIGYISNPLVIKPTATYSYYSQHKKDPLFLFNIVMYGESQSIINISSNVYGQTNGSGDTRTALKFMNLRGSDLKKDNNFPPMPWALNALLLNEVGIGAQTPDKSPFEGSKRLSHIITAEEASTFFRLPIGSNTVAAGFIVNGAEKVSKTYENDIINGADIDIGYLKSSTGRDRIGFMQDDLTKHMLIVGTPGSGKTTFAIGTLSRLWKERGIPFLVIEPAKNEYRALINTIPDLQVFTPGKSNISPYLMNPFLPPKNVRLEAYKATLKTAFMAAVTMTTPLDKIFEEAINNCYSEFRWLDSYTSADQGKVFNIADLIVSFQKTFDAIGYTGETRNIGRAGIVRLKSMSHLFDNYQSLPIEDIIERPTVIELAGIENDDQKALFISLLLLSILAYVNANYLGVGKLRNVVLLEEAHVLLDTESDHYTGDADPSGIAQRLIKRMLSEIRAYGVGIIIADQSPRKVSADVIAMTDIKVAFRLVESVDKQMIADSVNMSTAQVERLSRLKPGEAFLFFSKLEDPEEIIIEDFRKKNNIDITVSDAAVRSTTNYWNDRQQMLKPYPQCDLISCCSQECDPDRRALSREIAKRIYSNYLQPQSMDISILKTIFSKISCLVKRELNNETFSRELLACVKVHLWRMIKYQTKIILKDTIMETSLKKE